MEDNNKRFSIAVKDHETMIEKITLKKQPEEEKIQSKPDNEDEFNENYLWKLWYFDTVHNFTKYFPMYNCEQIAKENNKFQNPSYFTFKRRKRKLLKRYSEYTLFPDIMYEKIRSKKKRKKTTNDNFKFFMPKAKENKPTFGESFFKLLPMMKRITNNYKSKANKS